VRHDLFLARLKELGQWRCETRTKQGRGNLTCPGEPYHTCRFDLTRKVYHQTRLVERRHLARWAKW